MKKIKKGENKMKKQRKQKRKKSLDTKFIIILNIIVIGMLIFKIKTEGIGFISTIGYFK
jgi:amino acid permease